jgi:MFS family permease
VKPFRGLSLCASKGPIAYIILYVALYAAFGAASPFWPKFFETRGLTSQQIGLILGAAILVRFAAGPLVGMLVDFLGSLRLMFATCAGLAAGAAAALLLANTFWLLFFIALVQAVALAPTTSIADRRPFRPGLAADDRPNRFDAIARPQTTVSSQDNMGSASSSLRAARRSYN